MSRDQHMLRRATLRGLFVAIALCALGVLLIAL